MQPKIVIKRQNTPDIVCIERQHHTHLGSKFGEQKFMLFLLVGKAFSKYKRLQYILTEVSKKLSVYVSILDDILYG